eukprot:14211249-Heterocapsa_arctica.AAC.1
MAMGGEPIMVRPILTQMHNGQRLWDQQERATKRPIAMSWLGHFLRADETMDKSSCRMQNCQ